MYGSNKLVEGDPKHRPIQPTIESNQIYIHPYRRITTINHDYLFSPHEANKNIISEEKKQPVLKCIDSNFNDHIVNFIDTKKSLMNTGDNSVKPQTFYSKLRGGVYYIFSKGSLHGLKYISDASKPMNERFLWSVLCLASFSLCVYNIYSIWLNWYSSPFSIVLDDSQTPIYDIPFPQVVICPKITIKKSAVDLSKEFDKEILFAASLVCNQMELLNHSLESKMSPEFEKNFINFLEKNTPSCSETIKMCSWVSHNEAEDHSFDCCTDMFYPVITNIGMCFGFNMMTSLPQGTLARIVNNSNFFMWNIHEGYSSEASETDVKATYPRRVFNNGEYSGLSVELFLNSSEWQQSCDGSEQGFKVILDSPLESTVINTYARIPMDRVTSFSVIPNRISTDLKMKSLPPSNRKCYFDGEINLSYFDFYTMNNCILECEIKYIVILCGCIPFFAKNRLPDTLICSTSLEHICVDNVKSEITRKGIEDYYRRKGTTASQPEAQKNQYFGSVRSCGCWPSCDEIFFNMEVFYSDLIMKNNSPKPPWAEKVTQKNEVTRLMINFKKVYFFGTHRLMRYDNMDLLASCGGVLGLFLGFSVISVFEIIYYVFMKPAFLTLVSKYRLQRNKVQIIDIQQYLK